MPILSMFFGIIVRMFFIDNKQHKSPHLHVEYQDFKSVISIPEGTMLEGNLPPAKLKLVVAWIEIHKEDLLADWKLAVEGKQLFKIKGLE